MRSHINCELREGLSVDENFLYNILTLIVTKIFHILEPVGVARLVFKVSLSLTSLAI